MKLNILLCDTFPGLLPDYIPSYESMFIKLFNGVRDDITYEVVPVWQNVLPSDIKKDEIYLITGSNSSSYDTSIPWVVSLQEWIKKAYSQNAKMVGICFGHQIIALSLGGKVIKSPKGWGTGIRCSEISDSLLATVIKGQELRLLYNHHDQVTELPEGAIRLATSDFCENEAFTLGDNIVTFQGHPEYVPEYARHLIINHAADEPALTKEKALDSIDRLTHQGHEVAEFIIKRMFS